MCTSLKGLILWNGGSIFFKFSSNYSIKNNRRWCPNCTLWVPTTNDVYANTAECSIIEKRERIKKIETKLNSLQPDTEDPSSVSHLCDPKPDSNCNH